MAGNPDIFFGQHPKQNGPYVHAKAITPADNAPFPAPFRAIYVGGAGDIALIARNDWTAEGSSDSASEVVTFKAVPVGTVLPVWTKCVMSTGTTATNLVGLL